MRVIETTIYTFDELSDEAKQRAREWWTTDLDFPWLEDYRQSLETFAKHFGVRVKDYQVGPYSPYHYETNAENSHFRGVRLSQVERGHMPTGFCADWALWATFYDVFKASGDAKRAFNEALDAFFKYWREDWEYQYTDEAVDEMLTINNYEFDETGRLSS